MEHFLFIRHFFEHRNDHGSLGPKEAVDGPSNPFDLFGAAVTSDPITDVNEELPSLARRVGEDLFVKRQPVPVEPVVVFLSCERERARLDEVEWHRITHKAMKNVASPRLT